MGICNVQKGLLYGLKKGSMKWKLQSYFILYISVSYRKLYLYSGLRKEIAKFVCVPNR